VLHGQKIESWVSTGIQYI